MAVHMREITSDGDKEEAVFTILEASPIQHDLVMELDINGLNRLKEELAKDDCPPFWHGANENIPREIESEATSLVIEALIKSLSNNRQGNHGMSWSD